MATIWLDVADQKRYRESYISSDPRDRSHFHHSPSTSTNASVSSNNQRLSLVSDTSSNTTSGIVSDRMGVSFDDTDGKCLLAVPASLAAKLSCFYLCLNKLFWLAAVFSLSASHTSIHLYYTCPISPHRPSDTTHTQWHHTDPVTSHRFCSTTHPPIYTKYTQLTQHRSYCTTYFHLHTQTLLHHILLGTPQRPHCTTY